jgi:hypothetical protein
VWLEGEGLVVICFVRGSVGDARCKLNPNLLRALIVAGLVKKLPYAL